MAQRRSTRLDHPEAAVAPWVWDQYWLDVLFLHWRIAPARLRVRVPTRLELDTFDGDAWVSLVLFRLWVRPRWLPFMPGLSSLVEVNLRTYVRGAGRPGIWFLSAHANNRGAIGLARLLTPMPYGYADLNYTQAGDRCRCTASGPRSLAVSFQPGPPSGVAEVGTLDAWLVDRDRLFLQDRRERWLAGDVAHAPWPLQSVTVALAENRLGEEMGIDLGRPPDRCHFSPGVHAHFGAFMPLAAACDVPARTAPL